MKWVVAANEQDYNNKFKDYQDNKKWEPSVIKVRPTSESTIFSKKIEGWERFKTVLGSFFKYIFTWKSDTWDDCKDAWNGKKLVCLTYNKSNTTASSDNVGTQKLGTQKPPIAESPIQSITTQLPKSTGQPSPPPAPSTIGTKPQPVVTKPQTTIASQPQSFLPKEITIGTVSQFSAGSQSGCNVAALLFALSDKPTSVGMIDGVITDLKHDTLLPVGARKDFPQPEEVEAAVEQFLKRPINRFSINPDIPVELGGNTKEFNRLNRAEMETAIKEFISSKAKSATIITNGCTMSVRKVGTGIEFFDSHGEACQILMDKGLINRDKNTQKAFILRFEGDKQHENLINLINTLYPVDPDYKPHPDYVQMDPNLGSMRFFG